MTEFEINKKVAQKLGLEFNITHLAGERLVKVDGFKTLFDPCNNAEQAWEIIYEFKIDISFGDDVHQELKSCTMAIKGEKSITRDKPFVAAMLLFLELD